MPFMFDPTMIILIPAMIFAVWAQWKVQHTYSEMSKVRAANGLTGREMAKAIMTRNGVTDVTVEEVGGVLSDHFDPREKKVRLSSMNYGGDSLASIAVAAHEVGHVLQHAQGYAPLAIRSAIVPVATTLVTGLAASPRSARSVARATCARTLTDPPRADPRPAARPRAAAAAARSARPARGRAWPRTPRCRARPPRRSGP